MAAFGLLVVSLFANYDKDIFFYLLHAIEKDDSIVYTDGYEKETLLVVHTYNGVNIYVIMRLTFYLKTLSMQCFGVTRNLKMTIFLFPPLV
jgi:hypothetical protein